ncbi:MAG: hypothetical protein IPK58_13535 [Acidobacteria bacterium]|nr:hypothetical protein [Acidobacteriota bacterium]
MGAKRFLLILCQAFSDDSLSRGERILVGCVDAHLDRVALLGIFGVDVKRQLVAGRFRRRRFGDGAGVGVRIVARLDLGLSLFLGFERFFLVFVEEPGVVDQILPKFALP